MRPSFLRYIAQTSASPDGFEVSHGKGIYLFDVQGRAFIDCISGIAVSSLGHSHPRILASIEKQLALHLHTQVYGEHITRPQVNLAERLAQLLPPPLQTTYLTNSGTEAVEGALKLARKYTGRYEITACRNAYHGSTAGAESLRSDFEFTSAIRPLIPGIQHIAFNNFDDLQKINSSMAALIIEPIQGEAGVILPEPGYLLAAKEQCERTGALLILDEIQTGMGRTGSLWCFEQENLIPDILLLAKSFGGGLPLGAFIAAPHVMKVLSHDPPLSHLTTFGGNAICCAASLEAINIIREDLLDQNAVRSGNTLKEIISGHPAVREVRGRGLMMAIDLHDPEQLPVAIRACREEGLLVDWFLFNNRSIRLAPPLIISEEETKLIGERIIAALDKTVSL